MPELQRNRDMPYVQRDWTTHQSLLPLRDFWLNRPFIVKRGFIFLNAPPRTLLECPGR